MFKRVDVMVCLHQYYRKQNSVVQYKNFYFYFSLRGNKVSLEYVNYNKCNIFC